MLETYTRAFAAYMRSGIVGALSDYCDPCADPVRLQVYRNGFLKACTDALRASYPAVEHIVGEDSFATLARPFIETKPPRTASLVGYGSDFPTFLAQSAEVHGLPYLASFATLDWAWLEVYFAEDPPVSPDVPEGLDAGDDPARILERRGGLASWARLVALDYGALDIWMRIRDDELDRRTKIAAEPEHILVWRNGMEIHHRSLPPAEYAFLADLAAGWPCGDAATSALEADVEFDLANAFATLLHHQIVVFRD